MPFHGPYRQHQFLGNGEVGAAFRRKGEDLPLPGSEHAAPAGEAVQGGGKGGVNDGVAVGELPDRIT